MRRGSEGHSYNLVIRGRVAKRSIRVKFCVFVSRAHLPSTSSAKLQLPTCGTFSRPTQHIRHENHLLNAIFAAQTSSLPFESHRPPKSPSVHSVNIMCLYNLLICPHPHQDDVVNLIYNPDKQKNWRDCDLPRPWGKLSCGNLIIAHPSSGVVQKCIWCTLALYASVSKFKTTQEEFKAQLQSAEEVAAGDAVLSGLDAEVADKEVELEELRKIAWGKRNALHLTLRKR